MSLQRYSYKRRPNMLPRSYAGLENWYDSRDLSTLFTDTGGTTNVTTSGDIAARWNDKSGKGRYLVQSTSADRPVWDGPNSGLYFHTSGGTKHLVGTNAANWMDGTSQNYTTFIVFELQGLSVSPTWADYPALMRFSGSVNYDFRISCLGEIVYGYLDSDSTHTTHGGYFAAGSTYVTLSRTFIACVTRKGTTGTADEAVYHKQTVVPNCYAVSGSIASCSDLLISNTDYPLVGHVKEVVNYSRELAAIERANLLDYLQVKWAVDWTSALGTQMFCAGCEKWVWDGTTWTNPHRPGCAAGYTSTAPGYSGSYVGEESSCIPCIFSSE